MKPVSTAAVATGMTGYWSVHVNHTGRVTDVTMFRGAPTQISSLTFTEPYGPAEATFTFPKITALEPFGNSSSDLWWLRDGSQVTVFWEATDPEYRDTLINGPKRSHSTSSSPTRMQWVGRMISMDANSAGDGVTVQCIGAMRVLDNYLAQPMAAARPTPVEQAIRRAFRVADGRHPTGLADLQVWPDASTWKPFNAREFQSKPSAARKRKSWYLKPRGLSDGQLWSGVTTRTLGGWNRTLTEYVDPLLRLLRTHFGVYTIQLFPGNVPVLRHRSMVYGQHEPTVVVNLIAPGVQVNVSYDYSQTITTVYGKATATYSGTSYDGTVYAADGKSYWFKPFASTNWVDPDSASEKRDVMALRREVYDEFPQGVQPTEAMAAARRHLAVNSDPGVIGTLTLTSTDPQIAKGTGRHTQLQPFPRQMILPGMFVRLDGLHGAVPGPVVMATEVTQNPESDTVTVTFDSKFRDYTTVREIRLRNRDSLKPTHSLVLPSSFGLNIEDPLIPWSYAKGSGYFPKLSRKTWEAYLGRPDTDEPEFVESGDDRGWAKMTRAYPPKKYPKRYAVITAPPRQHRGTKKNPMNPATFFNVPEAIDSKTDTRGAEVLLSQKGTIDRVEFMAVDKHGNPMAVAFHVSVWWARVGSRVSPRLPDSPDADPKGVIEEFSWMEDGKQRKGYRYHGPGQRWYEKGKPYPNFPGAWDAIDKWGRSFTRTTAQEKLYVGWGNHYEQAGYWPSSSRLTDTPSGLLVDDTEWGYDQMQREGFRSNDDYGDDAEVETAVATAGVLIFCDHVPTEDVYFIGRFYKKQVEG